MISNKFFVKPMYHGERRSYLPVIMAGVWIVVVLAILLYASLSHGFNANGWTEVPGVGYYAIASDNP